MKSIRRKELELEAILLGIEVTYTIHAPKRHTGKVGDRWYSKANSQYYVYSCIANEPWFDNAFIDPWRRVGSSTFFDLSKCP